MNIHIANPVSSLPMTIMFGVWANAIIIHPIKHGHREILNVDIRPILSSENPINRHPNGAAIETLLAIWKHGKNENVIYKKHTILANIIL